MRYITVLPIQINIFFYKMSYKLAISDNALRGGTINFHYLSKRDTLLGLVFYYQGL